MQHADAAEGLLGLVEHARQVVGLGDVDASERGPSTVLLDQLHGVLAVGVGDVGDEHRRARRCERECGCPPDPRTTAGHDCSCARQLHEPPAPNRVAFGDALSPSDDCEHRSQSDRS